MSTPRNLIVSVLIGGLALGASGCFKGEQNTCEYWGERLAKSAQLEKALSKVAELKCSNALPTLEQLYNEGQFQEKILQTLKQIGDKEKSAGIIKMALRSSENAKLAASIVADWKLSSTRDDLMKILSTDAMVGNREAALQALLSFEDPKTLEDLLVQLAGNDANLQGYMVNAKAIEKLGEIKSAKAVPTLVRMAFLRTNKGNEVWLWVRRALAQIGADAVLPELLKVAKGEFGEIKEFTRKTGVQDWEIRGPKLSQMLWDTLRPEAGLALAESIKRDIVQPVGVSDRVFARWKGNELNRLTLAVQGIGAIAPPAAVAGLVAIVKDPNMDAVSQRINAGNALAMIGTTEAQRGLFEAWKTETANAFKAPLLLVAAMATDHLTLAEEKALVDETLAAMNANLQSLQTAETTLKGQVDTAGEADPNEAIRLKTAYNNARYATADAKMRVDKIAAYIGVVEACRKDGECYMKHLADEDMNKRVKATFMLARGYGDAVPVRKALLEAFEKGDPKTALDAKNFALMALVRRGDSATGETLLQRSKQMLEGGKKEDKFFGEQLAVFGNALKNRGAAPKPAPAPAPAD